MRTHRGPRVDATILGAASLLALAMGPGVQGAASVESGTPSVTAETGVPGTDLVGGWFSADGTVRLDLRADGRYVRSLVGRDRPAHGTYRVAGPSLLLRDDSGLRTTVTIHGDALEMAGHRLLRR
jgi:hypothetical protein